MGKLAPWAAWRIMEGDLNNAFVLNVNNPDTAKDAAFKTTLCFTILFYDQNSKSHKIHQALRRQSPFAKKRFAFKNSPTRAALQQHTID